MGSRYREDDRDTIAAIATPRGTGGVAMVRVSGPEAIDVAGAFARLRKGRLHDLEDRRLALARLVDSSGNVFDEALVVVMRGPRSFTGEDTVEVYCHGGRLVTEKALSEALSHGARQAEPGEFTRRAYLSGRISLEEAEAVLEVVEARSEAALFQAGRRLCGELGAMVRRWEGELLDILAEVQGAADFPEDVPDQREQMYGRLRVLAGELDGFLKRAPLGLALSDGITVCLVGRPNVGKSSLFNALLREDRAIVTDFPGTTRDVLRETSEWDGLPVTLLDTAGLRATEEIVEAIGVLRAEASAEEAEVILYVVDDTEGILEEDIRWLEKWKDRSVVLVVSKVDLGVGSGVRDARKVAGPAGQKVVKVSSVTGDGLDVLKRTVAGFFESGAGVGDIVPGSARQVDCVRRALDSVSEAMSELEEGWTDDVVALSVERGAKALAELTGRDVPEAALDRVFSRFCVGK